MSLMLYTPARGPGISVQPIGSLVNVVNSAEFASMPGLKYLDDGRLMLVYNEGPIEADLKIKYKLSPDDGDSWGSEVVVRTPPAGDRCMDTNLAVYGSDIFISFYEGPNNSVLGQPKVIRGTVTGGGTPSFGSPVTVAGQLGGEGAGLYTTSPVLKLANNKLLLPVYGGTARFSAGISRSADNGDSWGVSYVVAAKGAVDQYDEMHLWQRADLRIFGLIRHDMPFNDPNKTTGYSLIWSDDPDGAEGTWTQPVGVIHVNSEACGRPAALLRPDEKVFLLARVDGNPSTGYSVSLDSTARSWTTVKQYGAFASPAETFWYGAADNAPGGLIAAAFARVTSPGVSAKIDFQKFQVVGP